MLYEYKEIKIQVDNVTMRIDGKYTVSISDFTQTIYVAKTPFGDCYAATLEQALRAAYKLIDKHIRKD